MFMPQPAISYRRHVVFELSVSASVIIYVNAISYNPPVRISQNLPSSVRLGTKMTDCISRSKFRDIIIINEFHGDRSLKQNFRAAVNVTFNGIRLLLVTHNISSEAENSFISAILPRHCFITASPKWSLKLLLLRPL